MKKLGSEYPTITYLNSSGKSNKELYNIFVGIGRSEINAIRFTVPWIESAIAVAKTHPSSRRTDAEKKFRGSMLWSQISAISANFRRIKFAFFSKTYVMIELLQKNSSSLFEKRQF
jgi:hypothetical protein